MQLQSVQPLEREIQRVEEDEANAAAGRKVKHVLTLIRHGHSVWNQDNIFTGWVDVPLAKDGEAEAREAGQIMKAADIKPDKVYVSVLKRAIQTTWIALEEMDRMWLPVECNWRLNERHYGGLSGLNKIETVQKHGEEQVHIWRRSYDIPPPPVDKHSQYWPGHDERYKLVPEDELPLSESLKLTKDRFMVAWQGNIVPDLMAGKRLLVSAHGNSLRALVMHLDDISKEVIPSLNIPTGVPLVYYLDKQLKPLRHPDAIEPLSGQYLGDQEKIKARIGAVKAQTGAK